MPYDSLRCISDTNMCHPQLRSDQYCKSSLFAVKCSPLKSQEGKGTAAKIWYIPRQRVIEPSHWCSPPSSAKNHQAQLPAAAPRPRHRRCRRLCTQRNHPVRGGPHREKTDGRERWRFRLLTPFARYERLLFLLLLIIPLLLRAWFC